MDRNVAAIAAGMAVVFLIGVARSQSSTQGQGPAGQATLPPTSSSAPTSNTALPITPPVIMNRDACNNRYYPPINFSRVATTIVTFVITTDGTVNNVQLQQSSGIDRLDQAVIECITAMHYKPATQGGQPVQFQDKWKVQWTTKNAQ